jgi:hypothetical protein
LELPTFLNVPEVRTIVAVTRLSVAADVTVVWLNLQSVPDTDVDTFARVQAVVVAHRAVTIRVRIEEAVVRGVHARPGAKKNRPRPHNAQARSSLVRYERHHHKTSRPDYLADLADFFVAAFFAAGFFAARFAACFAIFVLLIGDIGERRYHRSPPGTSRTRAVTRQSDNMPIIQPTQNQPAMYAMKERKVHISDSS